MFEPPTTAPRRPRDRETPDTPFSQPISNPSPSMNPPSPCWMRDPHPRPSVVEARLRKPSAARTHTFQVVDLAWDRDHLVDGALVGQPRQWTRRMVSASSPGFRGRAASGVSSAGLLRPAAHHPVEVRGGGEDPMAKHWRGPDRSRSPPGTAAPDRPTARRHRGPSRRGQSLLFGCPDPLCQRRQANYRYPHPILTWNGGIPAVTYPNQSRTPRIPAGTRVTPLSEIPIHRPLLLFAGEAP